MFFTTEFCDEASGSVHYITEDGSINYKVILKAVHLVMLNSKEQDVGIQVGLCIPNSPNGLYDWTMLIGCDLELEVCLISS